jgi:hypothetical protein
LPKARTELNSGGVEPRFFMSDNEWRKAHDDPSSYEIEFWGGIDLNRPAADEYPALRIKGFPDRPPRPPNTGSNGFPRRTTRSLEIVDHHPDDKLTLATSPPFTPVGITTTTPGKTGPSCTSRTAGRVSTGAQEL